MQKKMNFNEKEKKIIELINQGKTFIELEEILGDSRQLIEYTLRNGIKKKLLADKNIQKFQSKIIVDLKKEFKKDAFLIGRVLGSDKDKTFVAKKMLVVDKKFKTSDNTDFKPLLIHEVMKKNERGAELPTLLKDIAVVLKISVNELKSITHHLFEDKIFVHNNFVLNTKLTSSTIIPNYVVADNEDNKRSIEELYSNMFKNKSLALFLKSRKVLKIEELFKFVSLQYKTFSTNPFLRYKNGWENKSFFYSNIVPDSFDIQKMITHCVGVAHELLNKHSINGFSIKTLLLDYEVTIDDEIAVAIILDSDFFLSGRGEGKNVVIKNSDIPFTKNITIIKKIVDEVKCELSDVSIIQKIAINYGRELSENIIRSNISANREMFK